MNKRNLNACSVKFFWGFIVVMLFGLMISAPKSGQSVEDNPPKNPDEKQDRINTDHMVYDSYCKKTWVVDGEDFYDGYGFSLSIIITRIGEGTVEGHIALNDTVRYNIDGTWNDFYPEFRGTVYNGKALCKYMDKKGTGSLKYLDEFQSVRVQSGQVEFYRRDKESSRNCILCTGQIDICVFGIYQIRNCQKDVMSGIYILHWIWKMKVL